MSTYSNSDSPDKSSYLQFINQIKKKFCKLRGSIRKHTYIKRNMSEFIPDFSLKSAYNGTKSNECKIFAEEKVSFACILLEIRLTKMPCKLNIFR